MAQNDGALLNPKAEIPNDPSKSSDTGALHFASVLGSSFVKSAVQDPANGLIEIGNQAAHLAGIDGSLPEVNLVSDVKTNGTTSDWIAHTAGSGLGMVLPFLATDSVVGKLTGGNEGALARLAKQDGAIGSIASLGRPILSGAAFGALLTPTGENASTGDFIKDRAIDGLVGGATFGSQRAFTLGLNKALLGTAADGALTKGLNGTFFRLGTNAAAGAGAGAVNAETSSGLRNHQFADASDVAQSMASFAVTGAALDAAHLAFGKLQGVGQTRETGSKASAETVTDNGTDKTTIATMNAAEKLAPTAIMDVQARLTEDGALRSANSRGLTEKADAVRAQAAEKINEAFPNADERASVQKIFDQSVSNFLVREYDGVGINPAVLSDTLTATTRLLNSGDTAANLSPQEKVGLAIQLLQESTHPYSARFAAPGGTPESQAVASMLLERQPGKMTSGLVDLATSGVYQSNRASDPITVDLSPKTLSTLPSEYQGALSPDAQARQSLMDTLTGKRTSMPPNERQAAPEVRSYASQLSQLLVHNLQTQGRYEEPAVFATNGTSGAVLRADAEGQHAPVYTDGLLQSTADLRTPDLQPIFDHVSGVDNDSLVLKNGNNFLVMNANGMIGGDGRFGLYNADMRFLNQWNTTINGEQPVLTAKDISKGYAGNFEYTVPSAESGTSSGDISLLRQIVIKNGVGEKLTVTNNGDQPKDVHITSGFNSDFADLFMVRGWVRDARGEMIPTTLEPTAGSATLAYKGLDGATYSTNLSTRANDAKTELAKDGVHFTVSLAPGESRTVELSAEPQVQTADGSYFTKADTQFENFDHRLDAADAEYSQWRKDTAAISTGNPEFNTMLERAYKDLYMLRINTPHGDGIAAGIPFYVSPFGRDQLITSMQTLAVYPELAKNVLQQLASAQGQNFDPVRAEKPGKIMHELRQGEMARNKEIPFTPYYGTADATPLYLKLRGDVNDATGDVELRDRLRPNDEAALKYLEAETADSGYLKYGGLGKEALSNQGWKDSGDSIMHENGDLLQGPIALAEIQGYLYEAWRAAAKLAAQTGDQESAEKYTQKAADLKERFNKDFWMEDKNFVALALDGNNQQAKVIASNPGHLISSGILTPEHAMAVQQRLMQPDMFTGYGIRTLSSGEVRYNPNSYHNGSIWPHDNGMVAQGMHDLMPSQDHGNEVMMGLFDAAKKFPEMRLPEVVGGFPRTELENPTQYYETNIPQAWVVGSAFQLLTSNLSVHPDAANNALHIYKPSIPAELGHVDMQGLQVGQNRVDLRFTHENGTTRTTVLSNPGNVNINLEELAPAST